MLLRHTTKEVKEREGLTINPAKTCQPIGAMYAALGIHGCLPHSHGSQGCCSYHRSTLTRHYKEPVMAATSSFTEGASVFGGQANLLAAIDTIFSVYNPDIIAVHSTCLSETIGDDLQQITKKAKDDGKIPEGKHIIYASTPSFVGSHVTGYANMVAGMADQFAVSTDEKKNQINIIAGWMEPSDMREIKRLSTELGVKIVLFPDTSNVLDAPQTGKHEFYPKGGTTVEELKSTGDSIRSLALGCISAEPAAIALEKKCKVPFETLDMPIGISATDRFIMALSQAAGVTVPDDITADRGRLVDIIADMEQYLFGKKVALFGDPDQLIPLTEFLLDLNMKPVHIVSGTPGQRFEKRMKEILQRAPGANFKNGLGADMFLLHQWIKNEPVDLLIGNTYGKYIARDEDIPFIRYGFPILDRIGHSYFPSVGYTGGMRLVEKILGALMDRQDRDALEEKFELVM
ncbi:nitrogenase molybdenum-iron protein subunit beta [Chlorobium phaeobacteroides]|jgi:nitrogenase molybdenum-iron protein beta chain|uniref:Nitrogenase molybdenum-iron protein beta chain n=1 Tax=Chlorobium phaeobacteroides (strain DSM 266 / SMG 266 / 2430) TaxID=290317 RepID=A1BEG6_CHLPD|nr:nitrogenase molybdenum-iron protein subunit beta [Chlorobium phaeobacteroides]ABL64793.1 Mo-nitrogenase MoFe protein subunit NifK [Chlorobium phaeobacteroides DSM 266]MBV5319370.1 nitrogenase molybdenum-iron protein subunit beta [Chlorobium phaeobacteroides]